MKYYLLGLLGLSAFIFGVYFLRDACRRRKDFSRASWLPLTGIGFVTNFFDTLGIGSFAPTTSFYKFTKLVDDRVIPGTLNVGHCLPVVAQAVIYIKVVEVDFLTLISIMIAATLGAVLGAGIVSRMPVKKIRLGMGFALLLVAFLMIARSVNLFNLFPPEQAIKDLAEKGITLTRALTGWKLAAGIVFSFVFGALQTIGIGFYAPCMAMVFALGMDPRVAYPIMSGSCALLQPWCSLRFIKEASYDPKAAVGLTSLGIIGVLIAAFIVKSLPLTILKWVVVIVIIYTSVMMFRSVRKKRAAETPAEACSLN
jgi:uncharacterized membrane protein YfcA